MRQLLMILSIGAFATLLGCKSNTQNQDIPGSVIYNPKSAEGTVDQSKLPVIEFEKDFHDFGKLVSGDRVRYSFKFRNTGKTLLVISSVSTSCGCTVSDYPREPVKPGEGGTVDVSFDSEGRHGLQNKTVTVFSNTQPPTTTLRIQATVVESKDL